MTLRITRPTAKEMLVAAACLIVLVGGAFLAASLLQPRNIFSPSSPKGVLDMEGRQLDLQRSFFTAWAALILVTPALCTFFFRRTSESAARYWLAFWTFSFVAFFVHFFWVVFVVAGGNWQLILHQWDGRVTAPVPDTLFTVWWGVDVLLAWLLTSEGRFVRVERALIHLFAFVLFFLGSAKEGELRLSRTLGYSMGVVVAACFVVWFVRRLKRPRSGAAATA